MTRAAWVFVAAAGVLLAAGVGCYHPGPYGPQGYPTYQNVPPGTFQAAPGGTFVVPGGTVPGTLGPSNSFPGSGPTLAPPINGGDAPPYTYEGGSDPSSGNSVPNYTDPSTGDFDYGTPPEDGFRRPTDGTNGTSTPFYEGTALPRQQNLAQAAPPGRDYFSGLDEFDAAGNRQATADSAVSPASFDRVADEDFGFDPRSSPERLSPAPSGAAPSGTAAVATPGEQEGFGYDRSNYRWLRGVIDYDQHRKNWHIIYGLPPDPQDKFAGSLTLIDDGHLRDFQSDDVVFLKGGIDATAGRDVLGKPIFRVSGAELIGRFE